MITRTLAILAIALATLALAAAAAIGAAALVPSVTVSGWTMTYAPADESLVALAMILPTAIVTLAGFGAATSVMER